MTSSCTYIFFFFFSSRRRHTRSLRDWSSDVCSSDLEQMICNQQVKGSSPFVSSRCRRGITLPRPFASFGLRHTPRALGTRGALSRGGAKRRRVGGGRGDASAGGAVGCPSGQREQTVNLPASAYE